MCLSIPASGVDVLPQKKGPFIAKVLPINGCGCAPDWHK
jgi:hypothetical protein